MSIHRAVFVIIVAVLLCCIGQCYVDRALAADKTVKFTWNANTEEDLAGYRLYHRNSGDVYNMQSYEEILAPATTYQAPYPVGRHYWVLTAYDTSGNESAPSTEATLYIAEEVDVTPPSEVSGFTIQIVVEPIQ